MKKVILGIVMLSSLSAFSSGYKEIDIAKCDHLILTEIHNESQLPSGEVFSEIDYKVQSGELEFYVDKVVNEDVNVYQFVMDSLGFSITESLEFNGVDTGMVFRMDNELCESL